MKPVILILSIVCLSVIVNAQTPITPHLTANSIQVEIPEYTHISPFISEGLIMLQKDNKLAYVNLAGQYVYGFDLKMQAADNNSVYSGLFSCVAGVQSLKDGSYSLNPAILCQSSKMLMLDKEKYSKISDFVDGIAAAVKKVKPANSSSMQDFLVYLNPQGKEVFTTLSKKIESTFGFKLAAAPLSEGLRAYCDASTNQYGYINEGGKIIIPAKYAVAMPFSEEMAAVAVQADKYAPTFWGFIDKTGKEVIACTYKQQPSGFSDGFAVVRTGAASYEDGAIFINKKGEKMSPDYQTANPFFNGYALASNQYGKAMVIDKNFNVLKTIDFPTDQLNNDQMRISEKNPFGLKFINGIAACKWVDDVPYGDLITSDGNKLFEVSGRNAMWNFYDGKLALCRYKIDGKEISGFVNKKGEFVIYFVENQSFNFETPKPANVACDVCGGGGTGDIKPEPEDTIPCNFCDKTAPCYDKAKCDELPCNFCDKNAPCYDKEKCEQCDVCDKTAPCYGKAKCDELPCDSCNKKSKCYNEYECCDKKNPKSKCYECDECNPNDTCYNKQKCGDLIIDYPPTSPYHWYKAPIVLHETIFENIEKTKIDTIITTSATVYLMLNDSCTAVNPYDSISCGLIWVVPDNGFITQKRIDELRLNHSMNFQTGKSSEESVYQNFGEAPRIGDRYNFGFPYAILRNKDGNILFGYGGNRTAYINFKIYSSRFRSREKFKEKDWSYGTTDQRDEDREWGLNVQSRESGEIVQLFSHIRFLMMYMFAVEDIKKDIQKTHTANLAKNADGSITLQNVDIPDFKNITLKTFTPKGNFSVNWSCPFGNVDKGQLEEDKDYEGSFSVWFVKSIRNAYLEYLKGK